MNYFKDCKNKEDVKRLYRDWAKKLHPDMGGKKEDMMELQKQYENIMKYGFIEKPFKNIKDVIFGNSSYTGYGGYKYNNQSTMWNEYNRQKYDPRFADYNIMKHQYELQQKAYQHVCNELNNIRILIKYLKIENEKLKKKAQTQKRQLDKLKDMSKITKKRSKKSSEQFFIFQ